MKVVFIISIFLMMLGCKTNKNLIAFEYLNPQEESDRFIDKLKADGVDTIITYADDCSGCLKGSRLPHYVFWVKNNNRFVTKFDVYTNYNTINRDGFDLDFTFKMMDSIISEKLVEPNLLISHFGIEKISISMNKKNVRYAVRGFDKIKENELKYRIIFIDNFRLYLSRIENDEWKALNCQLKDK